MVPDDWNDCVSNYDNKRKKALADWVEKLKMASTQAARHNCTKKFALEGFQLAPMPGELPIDFEQRFIKEIENWQSDFNRRLEALSIQNSVFERGLHRMFDLDEKNVKVRHHYFQRDFARGFCGDDSNIFVSTHRKDDADGDIWSSPINAGPDINTFGIERHLYDVPEAGSYRAMWEEWFCEIEDATAEVRRLFTQSDWKGQLDYTQEVLLAIYLAVQSIRSPYAKREAQEVAQRALNEFGTPASMFQHTIRSVLAKASFRLMQELLSAKWVFCRAMDGRQFISGDDPGSMFFTEEAPIAWIPLSKFWCLVVFRDPPPEVQSTLPAGRRLYLPMEPNEVLRTNATVAHYDAPRFIVGSSEQLLKDAQNFSGDLLC